MTAREMLLGSRFTLTGEMDDGSLTFYGRASHWTFDGRNRHLSLNGGVTTGMLGTDYAQDDWLAGLAVMRSEATGNYDDHHAGGKLVTSLTAAVPYTSWRISEGMQLWGALGHGTGRVTLKPGKRYSADLDWRMAAAGLRGDLLKTSQKDLALVTDALWTETVSDRTQILAASEASVTQLRVGLEGRWRFVLEDGSRLTPMLELGARHDGGDAETGYGAELGGGVTWAAPARGLLLDLSARVLLAHDDRDIKDWGGSGSVSWDPAPETKRGPSLALSYDQGTEGDALSDLLENRGGTGSRWTMEGAWGFPISGTRFIGSPHLGLVKDAYMLGWRLALETSPDFAFGIHATRRESAELEHIVGVALDVRW